MLIGDVSGKGVPASLFMSIAKALSKSIALRQRTDLSAVLTQANVAVSPGVGFGEHGDAHVRIALVENKHRIRQAIRNIRQVLGDPARSIDLYLRGVGDNVTPLKARA